MYDRPRVDFKQFQTFGGIIAPLGHEVVPSDHRTVPYINTGNSICISPVSTEKATEFQAVPVAAVDMSTLWTSSTRILGTNQFESDTFSFSFISNKELSLSIRPTMHCGTKFSSFIDGIFPDINREFFHYDASSSNIDGVLDKLLGSNVHQMGSHLGFIVSHSFQEPTGMLSPLGLNLGSGSADTSTTVIKIASGEGEGLTVGRVGSGEYPLDARVNSNNTAFGYGLGKRYLVAEDKIPVFSLFTELGVFPSIDRWDSSIGYLDRLAPEAEPFLAGKREISLPDNGYDHSSERDWMPFLLSFLGQECGSHTSKGRTGQLGRKTEILSDRIIIFGVKFQRVDLFGIMDNGGNPVASGKVFDTELVELCGLTDLDFDRPDIHNDYLFSRYFEIPSCESKIVKLIRERVRLPRH